MAIKRQTLTLEIEYSDQVNKSPDQWNWESLLFPAIPVAVVFVDETETNR